MGNLARCASYEPKGRIHLGGSVKLWKIMSYIARKVGQKDSSSIIENMVYNYDIFKYGMLF